MKNVPFSPVHTFIVARTPSMALKITKWSDRPARGVAISN